MLFSLTASVAIAAWLTLAAVGVARALRAPMGALPLLFVLVPGVLSGVAFYGSLVLGHPLIIGSALVAAPLLLFLLPRSGESAARRRTVWAAAALGAGMAAWAIYYVGVLYLHGGQAGILTIAKEAGTPVQYGQRHSSALCRRNRSGHITNPLIGLWTSADRPPLQTGFLLLTEPLLRLLPRYRTIVGDSVAGFMFQLLWIPATWFMAMAMTRSRRVAALVVAALRLLPEACS